MLNVGKIWFLKKLNVFSGDFLFVNVRVVNELIEFFEKILVLLINLGFW